MTLKEPLPLVGSLQNYAWGGRDFIAAFTGQEKAIPHEPWAELWLGAHPKGPAQTPLSDLHTLIAADPEQWLGTAIAAAYEQSLPFLLKVLDVADMLSIQAHPSKKAAEAGFAREEAAGIPLHAANRNYKDRNHKPELGVALTDFYLLHGFAPVAQIAASLQRLPAWKELQPILDQDGIAGLYSHVMQLPQAAINALLQPLYEQLHNQLHNQGSNDYLQPDYWAQRAFQQYNQARQHDRGIFSIYWFNLVKLSPGEGIFQAAGVPHAYLQGACIELMANSDNVLRGGLTPKHIDVAQLLANLQFEPVVPQILTAQPQPNSPWHPYPCPVSDFALAVATLPPASLLEEQSGPAIYLLAKGKAKVEGRKTTLWEAGQALFLPHGTALRMETSTNVKIYKATVNEMG